MLLKGLWGCAVPTISLSCLFLQDPAQKRAQVDPRRDVFQVKHAGGAVSFQPSPALTSPSPAVHRGRGRGVLSWDLALPLPRAPCCSAPLGARLDALKHFSSPALLRAATCHPTDWTSSPSPCLTAWLSSSSCEYRGCAAQGWVPGGMGDSARPLHPDIILGGCPRCTACWPSRATVALAGWAPSQGATTDPLLQGCSPVLGGKAVERHPFALPSSYSERF